MKCVLELDDVQRQTLEQLSANHRHRDVRTRASGLLLLARGLSAPQAAARLNVSAQSVYNWWRLWQEQGVGALMGGHRGGRPRALSGALLATAVEAGGTGCLTLAQIALRVEACYGRLPCSLETLGAALRREGVPFLSGRGRRMPSRAESRAASRVDVRATPAGCDASVSV